MTNNKKSTDKNDIQEERKERICVRIKKKK